MRFTERSQCSGANTADGVFVADEMCTHEDARLCDGNLSGTLVKCPLHGSRFDLLTGKVLDDPADQDLVIYPVSVLEGEVFISLPTPHGPGHLTIYECPH